MYVLSIFAWGHVGDEAEIFIEGLHVAEAAYLYDLVYRALPFPQKLARVLHTQAAQIFGKLLSRNFMEGLTETVTETVEGVTVTKTYGIAAIIVNPVDYNVGTDRGGEVNTFEDFDIDYNQHKYLIETRMSGAMVRPKAAIVIEIEMPEEAG